MIDRATKRLMCAAAAAITLAFGCSNLAADTYYRWTNEQGNLVISDRPPSNDLPYETVQPRSRRLAPQPETASTDSPETDSDPLPTDGVRNPKTCKLAMDNLHALETSDSVRSLDAEGNYYFLSEEEKEVQIERARDLMKVHCAPGQGES